MKYRLKTSVVAAVAAAVAVGAIAIAQPDGDVPPVDPDSGASYGECVAAAATAGAENPAEECAELRPAQPAERPGGDGDGPGPSNNDRGLAERCAEEPKEDGSFGECVAEHASAFGQCVAAAAEGGVANPAAQCAELRPGGPGGPPEGVPAGPPAGITTGPPEGTPSGPPEGTPSGPPAGTPSGPPESTPSGPPEGTPSGPPESTPSGPPEGLPGGQPGG